MPPKTANKPQQKKSKKQQEEDDFEKILSDLSKATKAVGSEKLRKAEQEDRVRTEKARKHQALVEKRGTNEMEEALLQRQQQFQFQEILRQLLQAQRTFLDEPDTAVHTEVETSNARFTCAVAEMQGWRANMEDAHIMDVAPATGAEGIFCVFDGHSGKHAAELCRQHFAALLRSHKGVDGAVDFEAAFLEMDARLKTGLRDDSGCTAVTVHVSETHIACGWVGDSRAVLCRDGAAFDMSHDHKPENPLESERITACGGFVQDNRVNGQLAMSRAMGDFTYKKDAGKPAGEQLVIAVPEVITTERQAGDKFIVVACDGIFDVLSNEELIAFILEKKAEGLDNTAVATAVCNRCLAPPSATMPGQPSRPDGTDNMTIMVVDLN